MVYALTAKVYDLTAIDTAVLHRVLASGSDRAAERWREDYLIPGTEGLELVDRFGGVQIAPLRGPPPNRACGFTGLERNRSDLRRCSICYSHFTLVRVLAWKRLDNGTLKEGPARTCFGFSTVLIDSFRVHCLLNARATGCSGAYLIILPEGGDLER